MQVLIAFPLTLGLESYLALSMIHSLMSWLLYSTCCFLFIREIGGKKAFFRITGDALASLVKAI